MGHHLLAIPRYDRRGDARQESSGGGLSTEGMCSPPSRRGSRWERPRSRHDGVEKQSSELPQAKVLARLMFKAEASEQRGGKEYWGSLSDGMVGRGPESRSSCWGYHLMCP